jgi:hypothetical protein
MVGGWRGTTGWAAGGCKSRGRPPCSSIARRQRLTSPPLHHRSTEGHRRRHGEQNRPLEVAAAANHGGRDGDPAGEEAAQPSLADIGSEVSMEYLLFSTGNRQLDRQMHAMV